MIGARSNLLTKAEWPEARVVQAAQESYKLGVAGIAAEVVLWNGESIPVSFYLRLASAQGTGRETLGERLNDPETRFLACKIEDRIELLNLDWISYVRAPGILPEVGQREELGAARLRARVTVQSGYVLEGEFLSVLPSERSRLSDLLNVASERFLLFLAPAAVLYVNRAAIVRTAP
jgi:hypothetical protein